MAKNSLRLRLLIAGGLTLTLALAAAGLGLEILFERHVQRRAIAEMEIDIRQLLAGLQVSKDGKITLSRVPSDQRYEQPFSGVYWQIKSKSDTIKRSRSLWDDELVLPQDDLADGAQHIHQISGINNTLLLAIERKLLVRRGEKTFNLLLSAAVDRTEIAEAVKEFRTDLALSLGLLGLAFMLALWTAINLGLSPLQKLRHTLSLLRQGQAKRLAGDFPAEVAPLVGDLNEMLDQQERSIKQAHARAADLAHGLKTPLTAMSMLAEEMQERGEKDNGRELAEYTDRMQRYVERELILARTSSSTLRKHDSTRLDNIIPQMIRTMRRLPRGALLNWSVDIADNETLRIDDTVLGEVFGNVFDNARKWARHSVVVTAHSVGDTHIVTVIDDGPGVAPERLTEILQRGERLDSRRDSTGLGLSIVKDVMTQLGGTLSLYSPPRDRSTGLEVRLEFHRPRPLPDT